LRDILRYDYTIDDSITRMDDAKRTCDLILGVGDGKVRFKARREEYQRAEEGGPAILFCVLEMARYA
jgi:hypothetical protein